MQKSYTNMLVLLIFFCFIYITATSDYRQSLQFQNLNEQKRNIHVEVGIDIEWNIRITPYASAISFSPSTLL